MLLLVLLIFKHLLVDFFLQGPYQYLNKGKYGHPGGLLHAYLHFMPTLLITAFFAPGHSPFLPLWLAMGDAIIHYHMDWFKVWFCKRKAWSFQHPQYWWMLGIDQTVHNLTYVAIAALAMA